MLEWQPKSSPGACAEHGVGTSLAEEVASVVSSPGAGGGRAVGQVSLQGTPRPFHRMLVEALAGPVKQMYLEMLSEADLHRLAAPDDHMAQNEDDGRSGRLRHRHPLQEGAEAGAVGACGQSLYPDADGDSADMYRVPMRPWLLRSFRTDGYESPLRATVSLNGFQR